MATVTFKALIGTNLGNGQFNSSAARINGSVALKASAVALQGALDTAQAAAVAKGTGDAHVEIAAVGTAITAYEAAVNAITPVNDVEVIINNTNITSVNQLEAVFNKILQRARGDGNFTP